MKIGKLMFFGFFWLDRSISHENTFNWLLEYVFKKRKSVFHQKYN